MTEWEQRCLRLEAKLAKAKQETAEAQRDAAIARKNEAVMKAAFDPMQRQLRRFEEKAADVERVFNGKGE